MISKVRNLIKLVLGNVFGALGTIVRAIFRAIGLDVFWWRPNSHYVQDFYGHTANKHIDIRNIPVFDMLSKTTIQQKKTSLYYDRLYTIYQSLENLKRSPHVSRGFNFAEVGVFRGGTSHFIVSAAQALNLQAVNLYSFDTFEGHSTKDVRPEIDADQKPYYFKNTDFDTVKNYLKAFDNIILYKGRFQDTCHQIEKMKFCLVHLDVDIYEPTFFALNFFDSRMVVGGVIIVDDYGFVTCAGVKKAVDEFLSDQRSCFSLHLLTGQCVLVKYQ